MGPSGEPSNVMGPRYRNSPILIAICLITILCRAQASGEIRISGPGNQPNLGFACCEHDLQESREMLDGPGVISALRRLHAQVAVALPDFSSQRASMVRYLNQQSIPVVAWIELPQSEGYYMNADDVPQAEARVADFEEWTHKEGLQWAGVGLDIEPNFELLSRLRQHRWRLFRTLLARSIGSSRIKRAQLAYSAMVQNLRTRGYQVQIYQMPYVPAEHSVHSTLPDRLLGTVDIRGDQNYLMLYTSSVRSIGAGIIWSLGPHAQGIAVGSTDGDGPAGANNGPLNWNELQRDLIVAGHFTRNVGIYDLEGCIRQGFLPRLLTVDWSQSVEIPAESVRRARRIGIASRTVLWSVSNLPWIILVTILFIAVRLVLRRARRGRHRATTP